MFIRKGDYSRYKAEITTGNEKEIASESSLKAYETARDIADDELPTTHPMRLGLSLNFSVFHYEILNDSKKACQIAKEVNFYIVVIRYIIIIIIDTIMHHD